MSTEIPWKVGKTYRCREGCAIIDEIKVGSPFPIRGRHIGEDNIALNRSWTLDGYEEVPGWICRANLTTREIDTDKTPFRVPLKIEPHMSTPTEAPDLKGWLTVDNERGPAIDHAIDIVEAYFRAGMLMEPHDAERLMRNLETAKDDYRIAMESLTEYRDAVPHQVERDFQQRDEIKRLSTQLEIAKAWIEEQDGKDAKDCLAEIDAVKISQR